jgi:ribosomal-protein-alanine N-acetyltransferase
MKEDFQLSTFCTDRLFLRPLEITDANEIVALRSDKEVNRYLDRPTDLTITEAEAFVDKIQNGIKNNGWYYWAITLNNDSKLIGTICLWNADRENGTIELGYELRPAFQGRGLMTEAVKKILEVGFQYLGYKKMIAVTHPGNNRSIKLLQKSGFISTANPGSKDDGHGDDLGFSLLNPMPGRTSRISKE